MPVSVSLSLIVYHTASVTVAVPKIAVKPVSMIVVIVSWLLLVTETGCAC